MSAPAAILLLLIAVWLVSMTFFGGLAHKLAAGQWTGLSKGL